jgi:predicted HicB family RNase H-like nuclease
MGSIRVDDDLHHRAKLAAEQAGMTLRALVENAVTAYLETMSLPPPGKKPWNTLG